MSKFTNKLNATVAAVALASSTMLTSGVALAATDGTLGATSTGTLDITVIKAAQVQITDMDDLTLPSYSIGGGNQALADTVCIYSTSGDYTVNATGDGAANAFTLDDGSANLIPYTVAWDDGGVGALGGAGTALTTGVTSGTQNNASTDSATCAGASPGNNAEIEIGLLGTDLDAAPAGTFTGTLTILVTPV